MRIIYSLLTIAGVFFQAFGQTVSRDTLRLVFVGDIMNHGPQIRAAYDKTTGLYDYTENFLFLNDIFSQADFVVGNLSI